MLVLEILHRTSLDGGLKEGFREETGTAEWNQGCLQQGNRKSDLGCPH